jgi:hypothetical protein
MEAVSYEVRVEVSARPLGKFGERLEWQKELEVDEPTARAAMVEGIRQVPGDLMIDLGLGGTEAAPEGEIPKRPGS